MIEIRRPGLVPPTLQATGTGGRRSATIQSAKVINPAAKVAFPSYWNEVDVRGALYACHGRVCAYCCDSLPRNDRGDVEHFRPKSEVKEAPAHGGYWWVAYEFSNYLMSCSLCNRLQKRKNSHFPMRFNGRHRRFGQSLSAEPRALLDPSVDTVSGRLSVDVQDPICRVAATKGSGRVFQRQVRDSSAMFKWNIDGRLVSARIRARDEALAHLAQGTPAAHSALTESAIRYQPHAWVVRQILAVQAPQLLPTPQQELQWLLDAFWEELRVELALRPTATTQADVETIEKAINELLWAFAVLWKDPPAAIPDVEAFTIGKNFDTAVRPLVALL